MDTIKKMIKETEKVCRIELHAEFKGDDLTISQVADLKIFPLIYQDLSDEGDVLSVLLGMRLGCIALERANLLK